MYDKDEIIKEANGYYERNSVGMENDTCSIGMKIVSDFLNENKESLNVSNMLEIGCSNGFNLRFMSRNHHIRCCGIDPSDRAISYGSTENDSDVELKQGFSDEIPYDDNMFDLVYIGFCLYQVCRDKLIKTISETDRILKKNGGVLAITDFDTPIPFIRSNIHNKTIATYKINYSTIVHPLGYTLIEKKVYGHGSDNVERFEPNIQERVSTQIFYKEQIEDLYVRS